MYAKSGYRLIAVAKKTLNTIFSKVNHMERDELEMNLNFLGLIVIENRLKPETKPIIELLKDVNIRTIMCTGDNILTGLCVANFCNMISENEIVVSVEAVEGEVPIYIFSKIVHQKFIDIEKVNFKEIQNLKLHFTMTGKTFQVLRKSSKELLKKVSMKHFLS